MSTEEKSLNFIEQIIEEDLRIGLSKDKLRFRFPPEPNGYLHVGHASAICLNFGLGLEYQSPVNLRFDDTNPTKEEQEYVDAIKKDIESWVMSGVMNVTLLIIFNNYTIGQSNLSKPEKLMLTVSLPKKWQFKRERQRLLERIHLTEIVRFQPI